jgi:hypothetical protein
MDPAEWDDKFVADLAPQCPRLHEANIVGVAGPATADQARLGRDKIEVVLITDPRVLAWPLALAFSCPADLVRGLTVYRYSVQPT